MGFASKHARDAERINPLASPPRGFIAAAMEFAVVEAAHRKHPCQGDNAFSHLRAQRGGFTICRLSHRLRRQRDRERNGAFP
jgi:hypothetical protein